jgi:flavin-dependent dehydrogenase
MERWDVIVVGGGPAGSATALYLARRDSDLARRALVLEKARHPRPKVCAGGLIPHTLDCLDELGIGLAVPHVMVDRARVRIPGRTIEVEGRGFCAIVRRAEFDAALLAAVREKGVEVREEEKVLAIARDGARITVTTEHGCYTAPIVIGADGSGSLVRRRLLPPESRSPLIARAVMADVPIAGGCRWDGHERGRYDFDFRAVPEGLRGYAWAFPCLIDGAPHVNVGVYDCGCTGPHDTRVRQDARPWLGRTVRRGWRSSADLAVLLRAQQMDIGGAAVRHRAAPIRCFARTPFTAANVLLVGDAAGAEPLMGEGISFAFEYGRWAANEIGRAFLSGDFAMREAEVRFRRSWVGRKLRRLGQAATMFYGPGARFWLAVAARWRGAQRIGLSWYNGVDGWDRRSGWEALKAACERLPTADKPLAVR